MSTHILLIEPDAANAVIFGENIQAFMEARVTVAHSDVDAMTLMEAGVRPDVVLLVWSGGETSSSAGSAACPWSTRWPSFTPPAGH